MRVVSMSEPFDKFGVQKLFPDKENGITLTQDDTSFFSKYSKHGYKSIKGKKIWRKTFGFKTETKLSPDIEATIYIFLPSLNKEYGSHPKIGKCSSGSGLSIKLRGGHHSNSGEKSAHCYIFHHEYEGGNCNNLQKEYPHPNYYKNDIAEETPFPNWIGKMMGFKCILRNTPTPDGNGVEFFNFFDSNTLVDGKPSNIWNLRYKGIDTGRYGKAKGKKPFLTTWGKYIEFRMDNVPEETKAFFASVREIT